ncbi:CYTH and CHAD domain-containing protein [Nocardioides sp. C4-1]|uniref:CYTH and CHAD domain-containing protein n=1 Tax=Nocardioides sp. C4-1 TaxID=3151851 RepID=UPI003264D38C
MPTHHEVERAYAVGPTDLLPDLGGLEGVATVTEPATATLVATYLDTADLDFVRAGVTLRRRVGGSDEGWHLKVPAGDGRDEVRRALGSSVAVPQALARTVLGWTRGRPLVPVAVIETVRTTTYLLDLDGVVLAEVADDVVVGTPTGGTAVAWREVEVELVAAPPALLDDADVLLARSGIHPSTEQRKIGTVLAEQLAALAPAPEPSADGPAGLVLHARLLALAAELRARDCDVRRGVDDGVHQLRVACRRLRGALATYRPLVDRAVADPLRDELGWLARTLGDGRDAEVIRDRLRDGVAQLPRAQVVGPVRRRIDRTYAERLRVADRHAQQVLDSPRYRRLLDRLTAVVDQPPWTPKADKRATKVLPRRVERDWERVRDALDVARALEGTAAHDEALHDVRKAAKRLRYACETLEPAWGAEAKRLRKAAQEVTRVLGDRQDSAVARGELRRIAREATGAGESAFSYGVLHAREEAVSTARETELDDVWEALADPALREWLS